MSNIAAARRALHAGGILFRFIGSRQRNALDQLLNGEEGEWFAKTLLGLKERIEGMPATYEQSGAGDDAIAYLHYFVGAANAWITEKDVGTPEEEARGPVPQIQAFGWVNLFGGMDGAEAGYVSIEELTEAGAEIDLHWKPKPIKEIR
jgi:hypothetical protein